MNKISNNPAITLRAEFEEMFWPFMSYVGIFSYFFIPAREFWLGRRHRELIFLSLAYGPILWLVHTAKRKLPKLFNKFYELPLWIMGLYVNFVQVYYFTIEPAYTYA